MNKLEMAYLMIQGVKATGEYERLVEEFTGDRNMANDEKFGKGVIIGILLMASYIDDEENVVNIN